MAISVPVDIGSVATFDAGGTTAVVTFTGTASVGDKVLVVCGNNAVNGTITSVVDSRGNTWITDKSQTATVLASAFLLRSDILTAIQVGDTLTITFGQTTTNRLACAARVSGLATGGPEASGAVGSGGVVTSVAWNAPFITSVTQESLFFGGVLDNDTTLVTDTPTSPQVELFDFGTSDGVSIAVNYRLPLTILASTISGNFSITQSKQWSSVDAFYGAAQGPSIAPDFARSLFPWAPPQEFTQMKLGQSVMLGPLHLTSGVGPHPYGGFERTLFVRLHQGVPAAAGDVSVTADAGNLALAAAAAAATVQALPTAGPLVLAGAAPTPSVSTAPAAGALVLSAAAPVARLDLSPSAGALTLSAAAPAARVSTAPTVGNLVLGAAAAVTRLDTAPTAGVLTLAAGAPSATISTAPTVGPLTLSGAAPAAQATVPPPAGNLVLTAAAPTVVTAGNITISPTAGELTLGAAAPQTELRTIPAAGALTLAGAAATLTLNPAPTPGNLILGAGAPTLTGATGPTIRPTEDIAPVYVTF